MTYTYKSIRLHRDTKIFIRCYSRFISIFILRARLERVLSIHASFLPRSLPTSIGINRKRCGLSELTSNPVQLWYTRVNTDIPEAYSGYGDVISWTDDTGFRGATALVKLPLCCFPRWFIYSLDVAVSLNFAVSRVLNVVSILNTWLDKMKKEKKERERERD